MLSTSVDLSRYNLFKGIISCGADLTLESLNDFALILFKEVFNVICDRAL